MAAFRGMHVSPAKHSYVWLPRKCDYRTDSQTDRRQTRWFLCAAMLRMRHKNVQSTFISCQCLKSGITMHKLKQQDSYITHTCWQSAITSLFGNVGDKRVLKSLPETFQFAKIPYLISFSIPSYHEDSKHLWDDPFHDRNIGNLLTKLCCGL